jgi:hypothetical protein
MAAARAKAARDFFIMIITPKKINRGKETNE